MITKNAQFLEGFTKTLLSKYAPSVWASKPFETIFAALGPAVLWRISWPLGIISVVGEYLGFGPGYIGKLIDQHVVSGGKLNLSDENLQDASKSALDEFLDKTKGLQTTSADLFLKKLIKAKGSATKEDIMVALYVAKTIPLSKTALKVNPNGIIGKGVGLLGGPNRGAISSIIYGIVKSLAKGIIGVAAVGGLASMISGYKPKSEPGKTETELPKNMQYYSNVEKNVENTLLKFLDSTIADFSTTFQKIYKRPLKGSKEMQEMLNAIETLNKSNIANINGWNAFMAPTTLDMAYKLMPVASYEKIEKGKKDSKTELMKLLSEV